MIRLLGEYRKRKVCFLSEKNGSQSLAADKWAESAFSTVGTVGEFFLFNMLAD